MNLFFLLPAFAALLSRSCFAEDIVVAVGNELQLVSGGQHEQLALGSFNATALVALTYDSISNRIFFSDIKHHRASIFAVEVSRKGTTASVEEIVKKGGEESVEGLTFDTVDQTLIWTDGAQRLIRRVNITSHIGDDDTNNSSNAQLVHFLGSDRPRALVSDPCTRMLYWINFKSSGPTIERSFINGSHRGILYSQDLLMPHGLALDVEQQRLYWANNQQYDAFRIESGRVDGSDRRLIYKGLGQFVYGLALGKDHIYWTDWQRQELWSFPRAAAEHARPTVLGHFAHKPMGVAVVRSVSLNCQAIRFDLAAALNTETESDDSSEEILGKIPEMHFSSTGVDDCFNYCLNNGNCTVVDDEAKCSCPDGFHGNRCEVQMSSCALATSSFPWSSRQEIIALIAVSALCLLLLLAVAVLAVYVRRLSKRPRLRRRFIGIAKKKSTAPSPVVDIENCCNMNLCETPCFEPPTRTPSSSPRKPPAGDKQNLLSEDDVYEP